ncbi:MAG TPA: AAA family ATPase [Longimicrobium sp.]
MSSPLPPLPLVGREAEVAMLRELLDSADAGRGGMLVFSGESGIGKSRLLRAAAEDAERRGWSVAVGRAYPVEAGIPYAPVADLLLPIVRALSPEALATLTRGGETELAWLIPALHRPGPEAQPELKTRLLWSFTEFLGRLAARRPLLLLIDDLQWADASSLELLHFAARHLGDKRIALLASYNDTQGAAWLRALEQSRGNARVHPVVPLSREGTGALVSELFGDDEALAELLYWWTRGNPFFLEEILKMLVKSGRLALQDGRWKGSELEGIELPRSIREAVMERVATLAPATREVAELLAVIGTGARYDELCEVSQASDAELVEALEELRRQRVLDERLEGAAVVYDFTHPMLRETLYGGLGLARARLLHARVAEALESLHGADTPEHAGRLAYHFVRSHARDAEKAVRYLAAAGRAALARYANHEAADYLGAALERSDGTAAGLVEDLARARQRLGDFDAAVDLWTRARAAAADAGADARVGAAERRLGLLDYWGGRYPEALRHFDAGLDAALRAGDDGLRARLRLARAECFMEMGSPGEAREEVEEALDIAERLGEAPLLGRVHLILLLLHTWTGTPGRARAHGERALALAGEESEPGLRCMVHWGMGMLAGLTGDAPAIRHHVAECQRVADEIHSPIHRVRAAELAVELMSNTGEWDEALALAERTLATARVLRQRTILARLLVWTGLIYLGRGDLERGRRYVDEAWELSGAGDPEHPLDVHTVVPAHCGRAAYHLAAGEFAEAVRVGESGLAVADRTGYTVWAMHRVLPIMAEAYLSMGDVEGATRIGARLREDAGRLGHGLGLAWADACEAFLVWLRGDIDEGIRCLRAAAERLESVPVIPAAARLRRHFAARLRDSGRTDEALQELRRVHEVFVRLGAERELAKTREQIRELGARPPSRGEVASGAAGLTAREAEIARLVAARKSNKTIAKTLDISPRTVTTHLSNIFRKLEIGSRGELVDVVRAGGVGE